jgi:hypothetical protein
MLLSRARSLGMLPINSFPLRHGQTRLRQAKSSELRCDSAGFYTRVVGDPMNSALISDAHHVPEHSSREFSRFLTGISRRILRELAFSEQGVHSLEVRVILVARPFECHRLVIGKHRAGLSHAIERMTAILRAASADAFPTEMYLASLFQEFQHGLHHADVSFNPSDDQLAPWRIQFGPHFLEESLEAGIAAATEAGFV